MERNTTNLGVRELDSEINMEKETMQSNRVTFDCNISKGNKDNKSMCGLNTKPRGGIGEN